MTYPGRPHRMKELMMSQNLRLLLHYGGSSQKEKVQKQENYRTFKCLDTMSYIKIFRPTMMERSYKNSKMKCNLIVQVVILNNELLNLFAKCIFFCCINLFFAHVIFKLPINCAINYIFLAWDN